MPPDIASAAEHPDAETIRAFLVCRLAEVLRLETAAVDSSVPLAHYGVDSISVFDVVGDLASWLGREVDATLLWEYPTIDAAADFLAAQAPGPGGVAPEKSGVLRIQPRGAKTPFFFVYANTLGYDFCFAVARSLGGDRPLYVIPPLDPAREPANLGIEKTAAALIQKLRQARPAGPYILGGFCAGGPYAYEVARQLAAQGEKIERLVLVDVPFPTRRTRWAREIVEKIGAPAGLGRERQIRTFAVLTKALRKIRTWLTAGHQDKAVLLFRELAKRARRLKEFAARRPHSTEGSKTPAGVDWSIDFLWDMAGYRFQPYPGPAALFISEEVAALPDASSHQWENLLPRHEVRRLPGSHMGCITTHRDSFGETLSACLDSPAE